jgi:hypothetical protein
VSDLLWTLFLLSLPLLLFGRETVGRWKRSLSDEALKAFQLAGLFSVIALVATTINLGGSDQLGRLMHLLAASGLLSLFMANNELSRRKRGGQREIPAKSAEQVHSGQVGVARPSPTPDRPLSFMRELEAKEQPAQPLSLQRHSSPEPSQPYPVSRQAEALLQPSTAPSNIFSVSQQGHASSASSHKAAWQFTMESGAGEGHTPSGIVKTAKLRERRAAEGRFVGVLKAQLKDLLLVEEDNPPRSLNEELAAPVQQVPETTPTPQPLRQPDFQSPLSQQTSGPVIVKGGFSYRPQLIESRIGQQPQNGSSSAL